MRRVTRALSQSDSMLANDHQSHMQLAKTRLDLGLATGPDIKDLAECIEELGISQRRRAGKRLWREKQLVGHLNSDQMHAMFAEMNLNLKGNEAYGLHFTDLGEYRLCLS
eukprot:COSAG06_NODE_5896_length_3224_cov_120.566055_2_plen_110_part_00